MSRAPLLIFCVLTIRKHLLKMRFERSGRGQESSRGHKFSILENFLSIRDFTSSTHVSFRSALVGACLPQTLLERVRQTGISHFFILGAISSTTVTRKYIPYSNQVIVLFQGKLFSGWFNANTINTIATINIITPIILDILFFM